MSADPRRRDQSDDNRESAQVSRVLALLDASRQSRAALAAAADLAAGRHAELVALFVEELDLLHSAGYPFAREVGALSGVARPLSTALVEASLARQVERANRALNEAVAGRDLRHRLQVSRGHVAREALALAGPGDVLVLGKAGLSGHWGVRLGSTSRALILDAPCTVVIWDERLPANRGPLRYFREPREKAPLEQVQMLIHLFNGLFEGREPLPPMNAAALERHLGRCRNGAMLLHRSELVSLISDDPELLARIPVPIIVVP